MADLVVEFSTYAGNAPIEVAASRTEVEVIGTHVVTTLAAQNREDIVDIYAGAACWIKIAANPTAEVDGASSRFMAAGERRQFEVRTGDKVAVIADA